MTTPSATSAGAGYAFAVTRPGAEPHLKDEIARFHPGLRLSFSRPGLVTFKDPRGAIDEHFGASLVFARVAGRSIPLPKTEEALLRALDALDGPLRVHVFGRDADGEGPRAEDVAAAAELRSAILSHLGSRGLADPLPSVGDRVLDVVVHGQELFAGTHLHAEGRWTVPGGRPRIVVPPEAPSRAFAKIEEALAWSGRTSRLGEHALELGSAPGGVTLALLRRGVNVTAVDPADMDAGVMAFVGPGGARARHLRMPAGAVRTEALPPIDWLVVDLNLAPPVALRYVARIVRSRRPARGAVLTLKMNDGAAIAAIPEALERVTGMGFSRVRATQLPANRSEITVVAC